MYLISLNKKLREEGWYIHNKIKEPNLLEFLDLVSLGTICDVVPLIGLNTMKNLKKYNYDGVYLQKNKCLILDKRKIIDYANDNKLFISSVELN